MEDGYSCGYQGKLDVFPGMIVNSDGSESCDGCETFGSGPIRSRRSM